MELTVRELLCFARGCGAAKFCPSWQHCRPARWPWRRVGALTIGAARSPAIILDANQHTAECQRLVAVVRDLVADPARAIETSSDTDEDKAEVLDKTRRRKTAALKNAAQ
jgi:hypothetical protein